MITVTDSHAYLKDNLTIVPSVSQLVRYATDENYDGIPLSILNAAADFGTEIHEAIQNYLQDGTESVFFDEKLNNAYQQFLQLKDEHIGKDNLIEQQIDYEERYAGRIDLLSDGVLIDFKTNYRFDDKLKSHLEWQLGYYKLALEKMGRTVSSCYCLWLPKKGKGRWEEIEPKSEYELLKNLELYEQATSDIRYY